MNTLDTLFKKVTFDDYDIVSWYLKTYPAEGVDYSIFTIFTWGMLYNYEYAIYKDRLIFLNPEYSFMLAPIGEKFTAEELYQLNNCCQKIHSGIEIMAVTEDYVQNTPNLADYFTITNDEDWNDYVYLVDDMVYLTGKKLAKKKNLIAQFKNNNPNTSIIPIDCGDLDEILKFCYYWKDIHGNKGDYLDLEFETIKSCLTNWDKLPTEGIKLYSDGKLCAFSVYSRQTDDMVAVHFEKYDPVVKGAAQIINWESAKIQQSLGYKYINREQDMGSPGIRQAKRSYQPVRMVPFYRFKSVVR